MIKIYKIVRRIYDINKSKWDQDKQEGFKQCLGLFLIGIEKHEAFNAHLENDILKKEVSDFKYEIKRLNKSGKVKELEIQLVKRKEEITKLNSTINQRNNLVRAYRELFKIAGISGTRVAKKLFEIEELEKIK